MSANKRKTTSVSTTTEKKAKATHVAAAAPKVVAAKKTTGSTDELFDLLTDDEKKTAMADMYAKVYIEVSLCLPIKMMLFSCIGGRNDRQCMYFASYFEAFRQGRCLQHIRKQEEVHPIRFRRSPSG